MSVARKRKCDVCW